MLRAFSLPFSCICLWEQWQVLFAGLAVTGKNEGGERSFFLSEQLTAELTWLTIES